MQTKPRYLWPDYASQFRDRSVVDAYKYRAPYPDETFDVLLGLVIGTPRTMLDAGCGRGEIARPMAALLERVDAIDFSLEMLEQGKRLQGGDNPRLNWTHAPVEEAPLNPPYGLITAGASLHWMDWDVVLPRFAESLSPGARLAVVAVQLQPPPWEDRLRELIPRFSTNRDFPTFAPFDLIPELERRGLFARQGEHLTAPVLFTQAVGDYVESFHSMNGFSRERMSPDMAAAFDAEVEALVTPYASSDNLALHVMSHVLWGTPLAAQIK
jgi:SAM-dependent methyltransferase